MNQESNASDHQNDTDDNAIQATAERLIEREVLACQSSLIDVLMQQEAVEGFSFEDLENAYAESEDGEMELQEVFEWWLVTPWLARKLAALEEPVLDNGYGYWWGRTCTGQAISLDGTMQQVARSIHQGD